MHMIAGNAVSQLRNDRLPELMSTNWNMIWTMPDQRRKGGIRHDGTKMQDMMKTSKYQMIDLPPAKHT